MPVNVLVGSVGAKVPLIETLRETLAAPKIGGLLIGGDSNPEALGKYFCDSFIEMPPVGQDGAFQLILSLFKDAGIDIVFPTRDGELPFYARNRHEFAEHGIHVMVSPPETIAILQDKLKFAQVLSAWGFPATPTAILAETLSNSADRFVAKPRTGAGAKDVLLDLSRDDLLCLAPNCQDFIFQPFIRGKEFSVDLYLSRQGTPVGAVCRERVMVRDGESQITQSVRKPEVEDLCLAVAQKLGIRGHAIMQLIIDEDDRPHLIECNGRFGGASTLSVAMGLKSFMWFIAEVSGQETPEFVRSGREKKQVRYKKDLVFDL